MSRRAGTSAESCGLAPRDTGDAPLNSWAIVVRGRAPGSTGTEDQKLLRSREPAVGFQETDSRVLWHSLLGCAFFGAYVAVMFVLMKVRPVPFVVALSPKSSVHESASPSASR